MKKIGVIGTGTMGIGISQVLAQNGYLIFLKSIRGNGSEAIKKLENNLSRLVKKEKINLVTKENILKNIEVVDNNLELADCDLIIESVVENIDIKKSVFKELDKICKEDTILATNTSSLSITDIASSTKRPDKVIGIHFFNPATIMKLVELVKGLQTADNTYEKCKELIDNINKTPVKVNEAPGFVVNRILIPMINEAIGIYADGVASVEDIDLAMKLGANHPMGPLELCDFIGLDICLNIMEEIHSKTSDDKYRPNPLLKEYVRAGWLGRKTKKGFYSYN